MLRRLLEKFGRRGEQSQVPRSGDDILTIPFVDGLQITGTKAAMGAHLRAELRRMEKNAKNRGGLGVTISRDQYPIAELGAETIWVITGDLRYLLSAESAERATFAENISGGGTAYRMLLPDPRMPWSSSSLWPIDRLSFGTQIERLKQDPLVVSAGTRVAIHMIDPDQMLITQEARVVDPHITPVMCAMSTGDGKYIVSTRVFGGMIPSIKGMMDGR